MFVKKKTKGRAESVFHFHLWQCGKYKKHHKDRLQTVTKKKKAQAAPPVFCWPEVSEFYFTLSLDFNSQT